MEYMAKRKPEEFRPIDVTFRIQSQAELDNLQRFLAFDGTVPSAVREYDVTTGDDAALRIHNKRHGGRHSSDYAVFEYDDDLAGFVFRFMGGLRNAVVGALVDDCEQNGASAQIDGAGLLK
jgi:hypothetical protein